MSVDTIFKFFKTSAITWETARAHRGYTAEIEYTLPSGPYTLTITGAGAPAPAEYVTLRNAKNAFRKFMLDKDVT